MSVTPPTATSPVNTGSLAPVAASEVCGVTVEGPAGRADLAIPLSTPLGLLLPVLARHVADEADRDTPWVLQRIGGEPLDADGTPATLGLRHGDVLHLRPAADPLPALNFDDVADGVAQVVAGLPGGWRPELTRRLTLAMAVFALAALAATLLGLGPGADASAGCGVVAVLLAAGSVVARRLDREHRVALVAGLCAMAFGALAGLTFRQGPRGGYAPGLPGVLMATWYGVTVAVVLLALRSLPAAAPGTVLLTGLAAALAAALMSASGCHGGQAVSVVAVAMFVLGHFGPRLSLRIARLRVPLLPHNAEELQEDITPESRELTEEKVRRASSYLDTLSVSSALVFAVGFWYMTHLDGWIGWVLPLVFAASVLLRSRSLDRAVQRVPMVTAGTVGLAAVLLTRFAPASTGARVGAAIVLIAAAGVLLAAVIWLPGGRLLPVWGHSGDLLEMISAVALLPLLLQSLHAYTYFRSLTS